jgi:hypothetical protein
LILTDLYFALQTGCTLAKTMLAAGIAINVVNIGLQYRSFSGLVQFLR